MKESNKGVKEMAEYRYVHTRFWEDPDMLELTREQKYFYLYLLTNPKSSQCGISEFSLKLAAIHTGYSEETLLDLIHVFEDELGKIKYNPETKEIAIKNWGKYNYLADNEKVRKHIESEFKKVKDVRLIEFVKEGKSYIPGKEDKQKKTKNEEKKKYEDGVFLTPKEYEKLINEIGENPTKEYIKDLSLYIQSKGRRYKSHYATILAWYRKDRKQVRVKAQAKGEDEDSGYEKYQSKKMTKEEIDKSMKMGQREAKKALEKLKKQPVPKSKSKGKMPMKEKTKKSIEKDSRLR